ncbi:MAG TPA: zf-HC2 domain-containing protein [Anaerolineales bacterium]|nr:zf-HC2 domain-containing protein [Anaerolineales bacterium]
MSHRPFEEWILGEEPLTPAESDALRRHLETCEACRRLAASWPAVQTQLRSATLAQPMAGFVLRWRERRAATAGARPQRAWWIFAASLASAGLAAAVVLWDLASLLASPSTALQTWIRDLVQWSVFLRAASDILQAAASILPVGLIGGIGLGLMAAIAGLVAVWVISLNRTAHEGVRS